MTVAGHLTELRRRLLLCGGVWVAFSVLAFIFIRPFVNLLLSLSTGFHFVYLAPEELLTAYMKLALVLGTVFASPLILWEIWAFVEPGLKPAEQRGVRAALLAGFGCFLAGAVFCYFIVLPMTLRFFWEFNGLTSITSSISFSSYMTFDLSMLLVFGLVFEMPVLAFLLARLGVLKSSWLRKGRKYAVLIVFTLAAIITPPDVASQIIAAIPMLLLYELSVWVSVLAERRKKQEVRS